MSVHIEWLTTACLVRVLGAGVDLGYETPTEDEVNLYLGDDGAVVGGTYEDMVRFLDRCREAVEVFWARDAE